MDKKVTTLAIIGTILIIIVGLAFIPKDIMESYGILVFVAAVFLFIVVVGVVVYLNNKSSKKGDAKHVEHKGHVMHSEPRPKPSPPKKVEKKPEPASRTSPRDRHLHGEKMQGEKIPRKESKDVRNLEKDRVLVESEIKEAEKRFLKHKIDNNTFNSISRDANKRLIEIEAEIDTIKRQDLSGTKQRKMEYMSNDKQVVLEKLLNEKTNKIRQIKIAEKKYLKRKISESTYRSIKSEVDKESISIDLQIKALQKASEVDKIKLELKASLDEVAKQKNLSKKRMEEQLEEDILDQLPFGR